MNALTPPNVAPGVGVQTQIGAAGFLWVERVDGSVTGTLTLSEPWTPRYSADGLRALVEQQCAYKLASAGFRVSANQTG